MTQVHPLQTEELWTLPRAAREAPSATGRGVHINTVRKWASVGVQAIDGNGRIVLETLRIGGRWVTSRQALERFLRATAGKPGQYQPEHTPAA